MLSDWKIGDLALCVEAGVLTGCPCGFPHLGNPGLVVGRTYHVRAIGVGEQYSSGFGCNGPCLAFDGGIAGDMRRFVKIKPDEPKACEEEFRILLNLSKKRVKA